MQTFNITQLISDAHHAAVASGWWKDRLTGNSFRADQIKWHQKLALIHSEVSEALEGDRKNKFDEHLTHRKSVEVELGDALIRIGDLAGFLGLEGSFWAMSYAGPTLTTEHFRKLDVAEQLSIVHMTISWAAEELIENKKSWWISLQYAVGLILEMADVHGYDMTAVCYEKMAYNAQRADHKLENRNKENGKVY